MKYRPLILASLLLLCIAGYAASPPAGHERLRIKCIRGFIPRGGHIQGVQALTIQGKKAIVLSGSSNTYSYYAIAYQDRDRLYSVKYVKRIAPVPYKHAGGIQVCGNILAVGIEDNSTRDKSKILLFDISDPGNSDKAPLDSIKREGKYEEATAGAVGITRYKTGYMVAVGDWGPNNIDTYICEDTTKGNIHFRPFMSWKLGEGKDKATKWASFQSIQLNVDKNDITMTGCARQSGKSVATTFRLKFSDANKLVLDYVTNESYPFTKGVSFRFGGGVMFKGSTIEVLATQRMPRRWIRVDYIH